MITLGELRFAPALTTGPVSGAITLRAQLARVRPL